MSEDLKTALSIIRDRIRYWSTKRERRGLPPGIIEIELARVERLIIDATKRAA